VAAGCSDSGGDKAPAKKSEPAKPSVVMSVSIDWEGAFLDEEALAALTRFRTDNPDLHVTHFICPAYYTKPQAVAADVTAALRAQIHPGDEVGVHLHAWNSLVQAAGVPVRPGSSFLTADGRLMEFDGDAGFDLDPTVYTVSELRSILSTSRRLLESAGLKVAPIFRVGGWLGTRSVLEAARAEGFTVDASAIDPTWLGDAAGEEEFQQLAVRLKDVWPKVDRTTQPYLIETAAGQLLEVPDSAGMADQVASDEVEDHVQRAARQARQPVFVHVGLVAETADEHADDLTNALGNLRRQKIPMQQVTVGRAAELARAALGLK
jgi:hypothetical protein